MKRKKTTKTQPKAKLQLHRETLQALEPPDLEGVVVGAVTSFCRSGNTCCNASCIGEC